MKRKKQDQWKHFVGKVDEKKKDILQKQSPGRFLQERCSKIFAKVTGKHVYQGAFFLKKSLRMQACNFIQKEAHACFFSCETFKTLQNSFFIVQP